jgi:hypothetical protein
VKQPGDFVFQIPLPRRFPKARVGVNAPCPCGSGRKFKKCCRNAPVPAITLVPSELVAETDRITRLHEKRRREHLSKHGHAREAVHATHRGRKFVAVGNALHYNAPGRLWRTFHDFLMDYVCRCFGSSWAKVEEAKGINDQHPVFRMYQGWRTFLRAHANDPDVDGVCQTPWTGDVAGLLTLAHDLFTIADNAELQDRLLVRLRHPEQYQGARYEVFAVATCVRAGFSVAYEDETDNSQKHAEFIAVHKATGVKVAVEAKSRHRHGVLGFKSSRPPVTVDTNEHRAGIRRLLVDAVKKEPGRPYVVFVDVNLPGAAPSNPEGPAWFREVGQETLPRLPVEQQRKINLLICTNVAFHYAPTASVPLIFSSAHETLNPAFPVKQEFLEAIVQATQLFRNVPHEFPGETLSRR